MFVDRVDLDNALCQVAPYANRAVSDNLRHGLPLSMLQIDDFEHHQSDGVSGLKIDVGPGYRVLHERAGELVVLLAGGDKSTQQQDIKSAIALARNL